MQFMDLCPIFLPFYIFVKFLNKFVHRQKFFIYAQIYNILSFNIYCVQVNFSVYIATFENMFCLKKKLLKCSCVEYFWV